MKEQRDCHRENPWCSQNTSKKSRFPPPSFFYFYEASLVAQQREMADSLAGIRPVLLMGQRCAVAHNCEDEDDKL